jgi:hypothetical protein
MDASYIELRKYMSKILATDNRYKSDGEQKTSTQAVINVAQISPINCVSSVYKIFEYKWKGMNLWTTKQTQIT